MVFIVENFGFGDTGFVFTAGGKLEAEKKNNNDADDTCHVKRMAGDDLYKL